MAKASLIILVLAMPVLADERIDALARAKKLCEQEKVKVTTTTRIRPEHADADAVYWPSEDKIEINLVSDYWEHPADSQANSYKHGFSSSRHPDHVIRHEIAHAKFYRHVGVTRGLEIRHATFQIDVGLISREVSAYATRDHLEFIAEVYAGLMDGKKYPKEILDYYDALWEQD